MICSRGRGAVYRGLLIFVQVYQRWGSEGVKQWEEIQGVGGRRNGRGRMK